MVSRRTDDATARIVRSHADLTFRCGVSSDR
jgi:hypothetical protein